jgi:hypothetical protein
MNCHRETGDTDVRGVQKRKICRHFQIKTLEQGKCAHLSVNQAEICPTELNLKAEPKLWEKWEGSYDP